MKVYSMCLKELKIASRGYYFYIEFIVAIIMLIVLLVLVPTDPKSSNKEFLFYDMPDNIMENIINESVDKGELVKIEDKVFKLKPAVIKTHSNETGEIETFNFEEEKTITVAAYQNFDTKTGKLHQTVYIIPTLEDLIRLSYSEQQVGARIYFNDQGQDCYETFLQGNETERYKNIAYVLHNEDIDTLSAQMEKQNIRYLGTPELLNTRQSLIPVTVVFLNGLMGIFLAAAYIFIDKGEGVIKALAVTPSKLYQYLISKASVVMFISLVSSLIITLPVLGLQPNYLLFILSILSTTFFGVTAGMLLGSMFDTITKAFFAIIIMMLVFMLPVLSYYVPGFSPIWVKIIPSYYMLNAVKESILINGDVIFVLITCLGLSVCGGILFIFANLRYQKTLTI